MWLIVANRLHSALPIRPGNLHASASLGSDRPMRLRAGVYSRRVFEATTTKKKGKTRVFEATTTKKKGKTRVFEATTTKNGIHLLFRSRVC